MGDFDFGIGASRLLKAFLLSALAVFCAALAAGIMTAPMKMHPVLEVLLKGFILLVFGAIAAGSGASAYRAIAGPRGLPTELQQRCPTCGESTPGDLICPVCDEPPHDRAHVFHVVSRGFWSQAFGALVLAGVLCLGIFILIGPYLDGERRIWALIAFAALGLLLTGVGAVGVFGFIAALRDHFKGTNDVTFGCNGPDRVSHGTGKLVWGKLVWLDGHGRVHGPIVVRGRSEGGYRVSPGDVAFAEMVATFDAAGFVKLVHVVAYDWRLGDPAASSPYEPLQLDRKRREMLEIMFVGRGYQRAAAIDDDLDSIEDVPGQTVPETAAERFLSFYLDDPVDIRKFRERLDADSIHRTQAEMHARVLRDRGLVVSNDLVDAVLEALAPDTSHVV